MIFQKRPRKFIDINFNIGTESIEIVQEYTYLGIRLTPTGNFTLALERKKKRCIPFLVYENTQLSIDLDLNNTASQVFDTMIFPI